MIDVKQHILAPQKITGEDVAKIDSLLHEFPYFQTAQLLLSQRIIKYRQYSLQSSAKKSGFLCFGQKATFQNNYTQPYKKAKEVEEAITPAKLLRKN